tara:strand:- start:827 stop:2674 length:1848 start_codon:yes stop_codon:yes gene_type:complete
MSSNHTQTYLRSYQEAELLDFSTHSYINALLNSSKGKPFKWKSDQKYSESHSSNNSTVITYSFPNLNGENSRYSYTDALGAEIILAPLNQTQVNDIKLALQNVSNFLNIKFIEVQDDSNEVGTIRIGTKTITDSSGTYQENNSGISYGPSDQTSGGDIFFNDWMINANFSSGLIKNSQASIGDISVFYHELFHALGIEHPNDNPSIPFEDDKNTKEFTLMASAYSTDNANQYMLNQENKYTVTSTPMLYDIAALQYLYGANNSYNIGDNNYSYNPEKPFIETLWDAGGIDTLDFSNFSKDNTINLNEGNSSTIGFDVNWSMQNNFAIAFNTIIENANGGSGQDNITGNTYSNTIQGNGGNDEIDGKNGLDTAKYSGKFSDYSFDRSTNSIQITDSRETNNDGIDTLKNIEYIEFTDQIVDESKVDIVKIYSGKFSDYKFYSKDNNIYQIKTDSGYDDITGYPLLRFTGESSSSSFYETSAIADIKGTFDQVTGLNTDSGKMFRLYNAAFKRLPDASGLKYWINKYSSGENDDRSVASSFLVSDEFKQRYGNNVSNAKYVETLYLNVLGRGYDQSGYNYWLGNLNQGLETRFELLLGFAESAENKSLFTEMTGWVI